MTVEPSSLLTTSIATIVLLLGVVAGAAVTWTRLGMRLDALSSSLKELRAWHLRATESAGAELDDAVESFRNRHHQHATRMQYFELRLSRLEHQAGIPNSIAMDPTPVVSEPVTGRHRRVPQRHDTPEESR